MTPDWHTQSETEQARHAQPCPAADWKAEKPVTAQCKKLELQNKTDQQSPQWEFEDLEAPKVASSSLFSKAEESEWWAPLVTREAKPTAACGDVSILANFSSLNSLNSIQTVVY